MSEPRPATAEERRDAELGRPSPWRDFAGFCAWQRPEPALDVERELKRESARSNV